MTKRKLVRYNGGTKSYKHSSSADVLKINEIYEVIGEKDLGFQTNYSLKDIPGEFNSVWFNELE